MTIFEMIEEWERGCSDSDPGAPESCNECTRSLINAIKRKLAWDNNQPITISVSEDMPTAKAVIDSLNAEIERARLK